MKQIITKTIKQTKSFNMIQSNDYKCSNNITNSQTAKINDKNQLSNVEPQLLNDITLLYPFIDKTDLHAMRENFNLYVDRYNKKIEEGEIKGKQTVKPSSELVFVSLVGFFASQLKARNLKNLQANRSTAVLLGYLPEIDVRSDHFAKHTIEVQGERIERLKFSSRTIRSHISRLHECGAITKRFRGRYLPVKVTINPEILQISDSNPATGEKTQTLGLRGTLRKKFPNIIDTNISNIKKNKRKEISIQNLSFMEFPQKSENEKIANAQIPAVGFTRSPGANKENQTVEKENKAGGQKFDFIDGKLVDISSKNEQTKASTRELEEISAKLLARSNKDYYELAQELTANKFDYNPINLHELERELLYGNLTITELKRILIIDFARTSSKMWKNSNVYPGVWVNALREIEKYFQLAPGNYKIQKQKLVKKIIELRYRINYAIRWFASHKRAKLNPLFPSDYFNISRKTAKEIGFRYTVKRWQQHLEGKAETKAKKLIKAKDSRKKVNTNKYTQMWKRAVKRYENNEYKSLDRLFEYVKQNLPITYQKEYEYYVLALENNNKYLS